VGNVWAMNATLFLAAFAIGCVAVLAVTAAAVAVVLLARGFVRRRAARPRTVVLRDAELVAWGFEGTDVVLDLINGPDRALLTVRAPAASVDLDLLSSLDGWAHAAGTLEVRLAYRGRTSGSQPQRIAVPAPRQRVA
jgi:hypothetical protein